MAGGADVNLGIDITKKGEGDKEAAAGLELVAHAADSAKDELAALDRKLLETRAAMVAAGKEFARTGDISPFKQVKKDLNELSTVRKTLAKFTDDVGKDLVKVGEDGGKGLLDGLANSVSSFAGNHQLAVGIAAGITAGAPIIGAAASAAILAGIGGGTLAAGIALAARDSRVSGAFENMFANVMRQLEQASSVFVEPLQHAADSLGKTFASIMPSIERDFQILAPVVGDLTTGFEGFLKNLQPGLTSALEASVPLLKTIGDELPGIGRAVSTFFDEIAKGGPGATQFFHDFAQFLDVSIAGTGWLLGNLSKTYAAFSGLSQLMVGNVSGALTLWSQFGDKSVASFQRITTASQAGAVALDMTRSAAEAVRQKFVESANAAKALADEVNRITNASLGLAGADLQLRTDEAGLVAVHQQHGKALQGNSADALANQQAFLGLARDLEATRQAEIAHGASLQEANAHLQANADALVNMATKAGYDRGQVEALISSMLAIPNVNRTIQIDEIRTHTDIYRVIDQTGNVVGGSPYQRSASQIGYGLGGIIAGARGFIANGPTFLIGERTVPEVAIPAPNSGISQQRADMLLNTAASYWGKRVVSKDDKRASRPVVLSPTFNIYDATNPRAIADVVNDRLRQLGRDADFLARTRG